jgi:hypothetical protein
MRIGRLCVGWSRKTRPDHLQSQLTLFFVVAGCDEASMRLSRGAARNSCDVTRFDVPCADGTQLLVRHPLALSRAAIELDGAVEPSLYNQRL